MNYYFIVGKRTEPGAPVGVYDENGGTNQQWDFLFVGGPAPPVHKLVYHLEYSYTLSSSVST